MFSLLKFSFFSRNKQPEIEERPQTEEEIADYRKDYKKGIISMFDNQWKIPVGCNQRYNLSAVYELFFEKAKDHIKIFSHPRELGTLADEEVLRYMHRSLTNFIDFKLIIPVNTKIPESLLKMQEEYSTFHIRSSKENENIANFAIMDEISVRFREENQEAHGWFLPYEPNLVKKMIKSFDRLWLKSENPGFQPTLTP